MPEQNHPPYNVTQPRQLVRWLDVNSQNGPLGRCQTYITIPAFNVANTWNGYSDIVCAFNYTAPNNFSFAQVAGFVVPENLPFLLCVSYVDSMDNVVRYTLNSNKNAVMFFDTVPYTNQVILKNFRIEVWSCNATAVMVNPVTLYTSVMQNVDTRLGVDSALVGLNRVDVMFSENISPAGNPLSPAQNDLGMGDYTDYLGVGRAGDFGPLLVNGLQYTYVAGNSDWISVGPMPQYTILSGTFVAKGAPGYHICQNNDGSLIGQNCTAQVYLSSVFDLPLTFPNTINTNI